jgi:uncharacterized protein YkwD
VTRRVPIRSKSDKKSGTPRKRRVVSRAPKRQAPLYAKKTSHHTALLGSGALALFIALGGIVFLGSGLHRTALRSPQVAAVVSAALVDLANADRATEGLQHLQVNPTLVAVAQAKANDMAAKGYFAHTSPQGLDPWYWFKEEGYAFTYAGENLAVDFSDSADVERAWMNSPTHRKNVLDPKYTEIGIATAQGWFEGRYTTFVVQAFGAPAAAMQQPIVAAEVPEEPTVVAAAAAEPTVLGSAAAQEQRAEVHARIAVSAPEKEPAAAATPRRVAEPIPAVATTEPALAAALVQDAVAQRPWWGFAAAFPREAMRYAYYALGMLILAALAFDTGLELQWHHRKHAARAGVALAVMGFLFFAADAIFFTQPVLAAVAAAF